MSSLLRSLKSTHPTKVYTQEYVGSIAKKFLLNQPGGKEYIPMVEKVLKNTGITARRFFVDPGKLLEPHWKVQHIIQHIRPQAAALGRSNILATLADAGITPAEVDHAVVYSDMNSGPSVNQVALDNLLPDRAEVLEMFAVGCIGGVSALKRAQEYLIAHPDKIVLTNTIETRSRYFLGALRDRLIRNFHRNTLEEAREILQQRVTTASTIIHNSHPTFNEIHMSSLSMPLPTSQPQHMRLFHTHSNPRQAEIDEYAHLPTLEDSSLELPHTFDLSEIHRALEEHRVGQIKHDLVMLSFLGDGTASTVVVGPKHPKYQQWKESRNNPTLGAIKNAMVPGTADLVRQEYSEGGCIPEISSKVKDFAAPGIASVVQGILDAEGLKKEDIQYIACHPGGPKVIEKVQQCIGLSDEAMKYTWDSFYRHGNCSSISVMNVLEDIMRRNPKIPRNTPGILVAVGPGLRVYGGLVRW